MTDTYQDDPDDDPGPEEERDEEVHGVVDSLSATAKPGAHQGRV